jgi:hypothetical protein
VAGGYWQSSELAVEGSKYIEIFCVDKWEISLNQVVLRLETGRIDPVIFSWHQRSGEPRIFIIGGHYRATINSRQQLSFKADE